MSSLIKRRFSRGAFTLVELLVVIGIIALLLSILLPSMNKVRRQARTVQCLAILRQWGQAQSMYEQDFKGWAVPDLQDPNPIGGTSSGPNRRFWAQNPTFRKLLGCTKPDATDERFNLGLICPEAWKSRNGATDAGALIYYSYGYNEQGQYELPLGAGYYDLTYRGVKANKVSHSSEKLMFCDAMDIQLNYGKSNHYYNPAFPGFDEVQPGAFYNYAAYRHGASTIAYGSPVSQQKINVVFWDNHAETKLRSDVACADGYNPESSAHVNYKKVWLINSP